MARYLSHEWFEQVRLAGSDRDGEPREAGGPPDLLLQQIVTGGPDGEVRYQVVVRGNRATLREGATGEADMTFTSDYRTASAVSRGELSALTALFEGRIRVHGSAPGLRALPETLPNLDAVPGRVRAETTYP